MRDADLASRSSVYFYASAAAVLAADQITKLIARGFLEPGEAVTVVPGLLDLRLSYNPGAAFGMLPDFAPLLIIIALVAIFAIVKFRRSGPRSRGMALGLGMLMGGAIGNLIDRLFQVNHEVTDFISLHVASGGKTYEWPTFNVADIGIVVGAIIVLLNVYSMDRER